MKHRAKLRVVDYFPHDVADFTIPKANGSGYEWCFWLILESGEDDANPGEAINVLVEGPEAEELLGQAKEYLSPLSCKRKFADCGPELENLAYDTAPRQE